MPCRTAAAHSVADAERDEWPSFSALDFRRPPRHVIALHLPAGSEALEEGRGPRHEPS